MTRGAVWQRLIGVVLMVDGIWAAMRMSSLLSSLAMRDPQDVALIVARMLAGAVAAAAGWFVTQGRPAAAWLAQVAVVATTGVLTVGFATGWLPTSIDPALRWPVVGMYAAFALVVAAWARQERGREDER